MLDTADKIHRHRFLIVRDSTTNKRRATRRAINDSKCLAAANDSPTYCVEQFKNVCECVAITRAILWQNSNVKNACKVSGGCCTLLCHYIGTDDRSHPAARLIHICFTFAVKFPSGDQIPIFYFIFIFIFYLNTLGRLAWFVMSASSFSIQLVYFIFPFFLFFVRCCCILCVVSGKKFIL